MEHKSYVSFESSRETCQGAARRHLQWVRDKAAAIASGEWREPSFEDDEGESLVGARVMVRSDVTPLTRRHSLVTMARACVQVMEKGAGTVQGFTKQSLGPSDHHILFDGGDQASTKLQRKGNMERPWLIATGPRPGAGAEPEPAI